MAAPLLLPGLIDLDAWREQSRELLRRGVEPGDAEWFDPSDPQRTLHAASAGLESDPRPPEPVQTGGGSTLRVPRDFLNLARYALCHRDPAKWPLLYRILWRTTHGEPTLLSDAVDDDVAAANAMTKAVRRDAHKMKAFVRFRRVEGEAGAGHAGVERYIAWHRPDHPIIRLVAPFFARRFAVMRWTILTPHGSAAWDGESIVFGPPATRDQAPTADSLEDFWKTYYANIFNPARINPAAMSREMPKKYWATLPEAQIIEDLLANAPGRTQAMAKRTIGTEAGGAAGYIPRIPAKTDTTVALPQLAQAARGCHGCDLYKDATQVVFGQGPADARIVIVGEQPGDQEDQQGEPFVGPAGRLLDEANAVKHFKWTPAPRGKRRIHAKPNAAEVRACRPWLEEEIGRIKPDIVLLLGATAGQSLLGSGFRVTKMRGQALRDTPIAAAVVATIHPSAVLRSPDDAARQAAFAELVADLRVVAELLASA
mgnify:CR=1 FL=1